MAGERLDEQSRIEYRLAKTREKAPAGDLISLDAYRRDPRTEFLAQLP